MADRTRGNVQVSQPPFAAHSLLTVQSNQRCVTIKAIDALLQLPSAVQSALPSTVSRAQRLASVVESHDRTHKPQAGDQLLYPAKLCVVAPHGAAGLRALT